MNRPGMNGFRTPATMKARREEAKVSRPPSTSRLSITRRASNTTLVKAAKAAEEDGRASPDKAQAGKKRGRARDDPEVKAEVDGPPAKKVKAEPKKATKDKVDADGESENETQLTKKGRGKAKRVEYDGADGVSDSNTKPVKNTRGKGKRASKKEADNESTKQAQPAKKSRGMAKAAEEGNAIDGVETKPTPVKKERGKAKNEEAEAEAQDDSAFASGSGDDDGAAPDQPLRQRHRDFKVDEVEDPTKPEAPQNTATVSPAKASASWSEGSSSDYDPLKKVLGLHQRDYKVSHAKYLDAPEPSMAELSDMAEPSVSMSERSGEENLSKNDRNSPSETTDKDAEASAKSKKNEKPEVVVPGIPLTKVLTDVQ